MSYRQCKTEILREEANRRGLFNTAHRTRDELIEDLNQDDYNRGSDATTVNTRKLDQLILNDDFMAPHIFHEQMETASRLVNEKIIYWTMNTFFSAIQIFFESGYSCTIETVQIPEIKIGLDPDLRFKMTDCRHEEDGCVTNSILPPQYTHLGTGLLIEKAHITQRTSMALQTSLVEPQLTPIQHVVFGIKLKGLDKMAYIWGKVKDATLGTTWVDVKIGGLRNDVPLPLGYFGMKPGAQTRVVVKNSLIGTGHKKRRLNPLDEE
ncbi:ethyl tert-butyl ether degradation ethd [Pyrenophora seminiperda CCB06]|uniref:Ethyl tert-butyl ether degradation ethd n=1 Tax=Pyrenophora seminiperda CCB06 TaxID=1302712 RepID=A0A3M7LX29_9PLEO|nr:ethyl tert-butyl ether degradation ethd [Pyrenophora seminiperda CCB06]